MSDHLSNSSVIWDRSMGLVNSDVGLNEAFAKMTQETKRLLVKISTLEESLAKERKLKAGFKVIYSSIDLENKRLRSIISRKYKKHLEDQRLANESELEKERSSTPQNDRQCLTPTQSASTQTSSSFSFHVAGESPHPCCERFCQSVHTSLRFPLQPTEPDDDFGHKYTNAPTKDRLEHEVLDRVEDLTERLRETAEKLREAEERSEMMAIQMETYKSDFMSERSDRENAMGRIMELEKELVSLKRQSEDHDHYHRHSLSCRQSGTHESFQIQSSPPRGTFFDDVLIARGPCQETAPPERALESDRDPLDDRDKNSNSPFGVAKKLPAKKDLSISSESLDLLPTEHGGDDFYQ